MWYFFTLWLISVEKLIRSSGKSIFEQGHSPLYSVLLQLCHHCIYVSCFDQVYC